MRGYQIFFEATKAQFESKLDVIVSVIHCMLVNDDFVCIGIGEEFTDADKDSAGSELLPPKWNSNRNNYSLKYRSTRADNLRLLLKGIVAGELFIASALPMNSSNSVNSVSIKPDQFVTATWNDSNFAQAFVNQDMKPLTEVLQKQLFDKLRENPPPKKSDETSGGGADGGSGGGVTSGEKSGKSNLLENVYVPSAPGYAARPGNPYMDPFNNPSQFPSIGRNDLDPFGSLVNPGGPGGSGMLFDPFHSSRGQRPLRDPNSQIPPGAIPPGAKYDPIGPLQGGRQGRHPQPDHLPPPGGFEPFL